MNTKLISSKTAKDVGCVVDALLYHNAMRAVQYVSDRYVVSACRPVYRRVRWSKRDTSIEVRIKIGAPNYEQRKFIRNCKKSGEPFPVKKVQLKFPKS